MKIKERNNVIFVEGKKLRAIIFLHDSTSKSHVLKELEKIKYKNKFDNAVFDIIMRLRKRYKADVTYIINQKRREN